MVQPLLRVKGLRSLMEWRVTKATEKGDLMVNDFGAGFEGSYSDQTRTIICGKPNEEHKKIYNVVKEALNKANEPIRTGTFLFRLDEVARSYIRSYGYGVYFGHGSGHEIGLSVHENLTINLETRDLLK